MEVKCVRTKEGDTRKQEFLEAALELFYQKGFENTTINNIIDEVGVSKGAFYHYFESKEEVLEIIAEQYVDRKLNIAEKILLEKNLNALEKFNKIIFDILDFKIQYSETRWKIYKISVRNNNIKLENQILENYLERAKPLYEQIINQGTTEGIFHTDYPEEVAELSIHFSKVINKMLSRTLIKDESDLDDIETFKEMIKEPENMKILQRKVSFYKDTLERILGVRDMSIGLTKTFMDQLKR